jgi:hypothetical protein
MLALSPAAFEALPDEADRIESQAAWVAGQERAARQAIEDEEAALLLLL